MHRQYFTCLKILQFHNWNFCSDHPLTFYVLFFSLIFCLSLSSWLLKLLSWLVWLKWSNGNFEKLGSLKQHCVEVQNVDEKKKFFLRTFLQGTDIFVQGNISDVIVFVTLDGMRKRITVLNIFSLEATCHLKIKRWR